LKIIAGPDAIDARGWRLSLPPSSKKSLREFKVAVMLSADTAEVDRSVQDRIQAVADFMAKNKAKVSDTARPEIDTPSASRFHHLGARSHERPADRRAFARHPAAARDVKPDDTRYEAWMVKGNTMFHREWHDWNEQRHKMRPRVGQVLQDYDLLLCPAGATAAFPHNQKGERLGAHVEREWQAATVDHADVLGRLHGHGGLAFDRRARGVDPRRAAGRRANRRPAVRRPHLPPPRAAAREGLSRFRCAGRVRMMGLAARTS
jgi:Asp-tRNA(Asn)/Glu-tRNA(Gln) amidotransferase A subunit family amidase